MMQLPRLAMSLAFIFLTACSTAPPTEPMHFDAETDSSGNNADSAANSPVAGSSCNVHVMTVQDQRISTSLGSSHKMPLYGETVPHWVREGIGALASGGYSVSFSQDATDPQSANLVVDVVIHRAYIHHADVAKNANVVVSVRYSTNGHVQETIFYRGRDTSVCWLGSASEVEGAMNRAMSEVLQSIGKDIWRYCSSFGA